jgi:hypothetical protein
VWSLCYAVSALRTDTAALLLEIQFAENFPFENIALEIKNNCKTVGMHNIALNQNLEGRTKVFIERSNSSKLFRREADKATWLRSTFIKKTDPFSFVFSFINYLMIAPQK